MKRRATTSGEGKSRCRTLLKACAVVCAMSFLTCPVRPQDAHGSSKLKPADIRTRMRVRITSQRFGTSRLEGIAVGVSTDSIRVGRDEEASVPLTWREIESLDVAKGLRTNGGTWRAIRARRRRTGRRLCRTRNL